MQKKANHLAAAVFSALMLTAAIGAPAVSAEHYNVYNYDCWGEAVPAQAGYAAQRAVSGQDLGCGAFNTPSDPLRSVDCVKQRCELIKKNLEIMNK